MKLIALGEKLIPKEEEMIFVIHSALLSMKPSMVMSDFGNGWGILVAKEAAKLGIPLMGVMPHAEVIGNKAYQASRKEALRGVSTKIVFEEDYISFLHNPRPYVEWVTKSADIAICYVDTERSSISHSLMLQLQRVGKETYNMYRRRR